MSRPNPPTPKPRVDWEGPHRIGRGSQPLGVADVPQSWIPVVLLKRMGGKFLTKQNDQKKISHRNSPFFDGSFQSEKHNESDLRLNPSEFSDGIYPTEIPRTSPHLHQSFKRRKPSTFLPSTGANPKFSTLSRWHPPAIHVTTKTAATKTAASEYEN